MAEKCNMCTQSPKIKKRNHVLNRTRLYNPIYHVFSQYLVFLEWILLYKIEMHVTVWDKEIEQNMSMGIVTLSVEAILSKLF